MINNEQLLVETRGLSKTYFGKNNSSFPALQGINLSISQGDFLVITGHSGSGKTTLLNLLGALDRQTSGKIFFQGKDLTAYSSKDLSCLRREKIGFIFQTFNLLPGLTVSENVESALIHNKLKNSERKIKVAAIIERFGLGGKFDSLPNELSVGQQQKVAIARAIVKDPLLILADEPTGEMDPMAGREILQKLGELNRDLGISVVVASHGFNVLQQVQRTLFLKDGKVVDEKEAGY